VRGREVDLRFGFGGADVAGDVEVEVSLNEACALPLLTIPRIFA
jgi:hypothetical protein